MATFPGQQELGDSMEVLKSLSENSRFRLLQFGEDEIRSRSPGSTYDPALSDLLSGELIAHGLVEPVKGYFTSIDNSPLLHLTQRGREVARLLTAEGDVPDYLGDLEEIRLALADAAEGPLASES